MIGAVWLVGSVLALPAAQGATYAVTQGRYRWPTGHVLDSALALLRGRPGIGLHVELDTAPPAVAVIYGLIIAAEIAWAVAVATMLWVGVQTLATGRRGLAGRHEIQAVLGRRPLLRRRSEIRPDLGVRHSRLTARRLR